MSHPIDKLIEIALAEVGTREGPVNNTGARIVEYQGTTWLAPGAWPWCAAFTCWVMREWLEDEEVRRQVSEIFGKPLITFSQAEKIRCRDASAFGWEKWAKSLGFQILSENNLARRGDFVVFDFSHIGVIIENQQDQHDPLRTIEGNTNGKGERDSESGDGVWVKHRDPELTRSYIRIFQ
ncbi:MAG: hypothetical protein K0Q78_188 [Cellvibrio sp.]|jgi:hypothetical protein|nr:hypothetical protein [Cellvibrio sp.]